MSLSNKFFKLSYTLLLISGVLFFIDSLQYLTFLFFGIGALFLIIALILINDKNVLLRKQNNRFVLTLEMLLLIVGLISIICSQQEAVFVKLLMFVFTLVLLINTNKYLLLDTSVPLKSIVGIIKTFSFLLLISSLIINPPLSLSQIMYGYKGVFGNPNGFGMIFTPITVIAGSVLVVDYYKRVLNNSQRFKYILFFLCGLFLVVISASRSSLMASILPLLIVVVKETFVNIKKNKRKTLSLFIILGLLIIVIINTEIFKTIVISKFNAKAIDNNILSDRDELWGLAFNNSKWFGINEIYYRTTDYSPHNTYLAFMVNYGYVFSMLFFILLMYGLYKSFIFSNKSKSIYRYVPFVIVFSTLFLFMFEQLFTSLNSFAALMLIGISTYSKKN